MESSSKGTGTFTGRPSRASSANFSSLSRVLDNPWFYFLLSFLHQCLVILPGEFPVIFPDSGSYLGWNEQRTPVYPAILSLIGSTKAVAWIQMLVFALAAAAFSWIVRRVVESVAVPRFRDGFVWLGSLYFATNFELLQFAPAILTESFGISLFVFYFFCLLKWWGPAEASAGSAVNTIWYRNVYFWLSFLVFPVTAFLLRPSFILVPAAITFFFVLKYVFEKRFRLASGVAACLAVYLLVIPGYAYWNKGRLGHVGISDIAQHQIFANYMARGMLMEEALKPSASEGLRSFAEAYRQMNPELRLSQYSLFEKWQQLNPGKNLFEELVPVNRELLSKRPGGYLKYSLRNMSVVIDGRASFNYLPIENRDLPSKIYFWVQFVLDNLFCFFWFVALIYFVFTIKRRPWFSIENLIFLTVATQFFTIGFMGYSELRRQAIGVASLQMLFVLVTWMHLLKARWTRGDAEAVYLSKK